MTVAVSPTTVAAPVVTPPRGRAAILLVVLLGLLTAMGPLSLDMYLPALPDITGDFAATPSQVQLSLTTCLVGLALGQLCFGPLSDRFGRRRPVILGLAGYAAFSLLCALAPSPLALAGLRLLQGVAGGIGIVVARAIVRDLYSGVDAARYFSRLTLVFGVAPIAAPSLGSAVLRLTDWRGVFVALGVIGALIAMLAAWRLPETLPASARSAGGLADTARTARALLADRAFLGYALAQGLAFAGLFAYISGSSFVLQQGYGMSAAVFSLLFGLNALGLIAVSQGNSRLLDRFRPRTLLVTSLTAGLGAAAGLVVATFAGHLAGVLVMLFVFVASLGMLMPNGMALALDRYPSRAGTAAAVLGGVQAIVGSLSAPLVGLGKVGGGMTMALVMLATAAGAVAAVLTLARPRTAPVPTPPR